MKWIPVPASARVAWPRSYPPGPNTGSSGRDRRGRGTRWVTATRLALDWKAGTLRVTHGVKRVSLSYLAFLLQKRFGINLTTRLPNVSASFFHTGTIIIRLVRVAFHPCGFARSFPQPDRRLWGPGDLRPGSVKGLRCLHRRAAGAPLTGSGRPPDNRAPGFAGRSRMLCFLLAKGASGTDTGLPVLIGLARCRRLA